MKASASAYKIHSPVGNNENIGNILIFWEFPTYREEANIMGIIIISIIIPIIPIIIIGIAFKNLSSAKW